MASAWQPPAERIEGFYPGQDGLALLPGKAGRIAYTLRAAPGQRFAGATLERLVFRGTSCRIEIRIGDKVQVFSDGVNYVDVDARHELTPLVKGAESFTLVFSIVFSAVSTCS